MSVALRHHDRQVLGSIGVPFPRRIKCCKGIGELLLRLVRPLLNDVGPRLLRCERRIVGMACEHRMHLTQAAPEQGGDRTVILVLFSLGRLRFFGSGGQIRQTAHQQIQRPGPGVALVANETLSDRKCMTLAIGIDAHDLTE